MSAYIFDTETTGGDEPRLIEAAWLKVSDPIELTVEDSFCKRFNPECKSTLGALATHHILDEELVDCPSYKTFTLPADAEYIIGHNVDYDWKVMGQPNIKRICTLAIARRIFPILDSHTQSALLYYLTISGAASARESLKNAHSAQQDVVICRYNFARMIEKMPEQKLDSWEKVWQFSERARIPTVMTFGKHKGQPINDIPSDYKSWLLRQSDVDPYLAKALRGEAA